MFQIFPGPTPGSNNVARCPTNSLGIGEGGGGGGQRALLELTDAIDPLIAYLLLGIVVVEGRGGGGTAIGGLF